MHRRRAWCAANGSAAVAAEPARPGAPAARAARPAAAAPWLAAPAPFPDGAAVRLRAGVLADVRFVDDNGRAAQRGDPGRGDIGFKRSASGAGGCRGGAASVGGAERFRDRGDLHFGIGSGGRSRPARPASAATVSVAGVSGFAASGGADSSGLSAAISRALPALSSGSRARPAPRFWSDLRRCGGRTSSTGSSATGDRRAAAPGSASGRRSAGQIPARAAPARRKAGKFLVRGAQQGRGAKPEHQDRHRQHDRGEQKTEAGEHGREFRLASVGGL